MTTRTNVRQWLAGTCTALLLAGCSSPDPDTTRDTPSGTRPSPAEAPKDRDEAAVLAALRQLDFCAVLTAAQPGAVAKSVEPFSCEIGGGSVDVVQKNADARLAMPMCAIGGAKAYVDFSKSDRCQVDLPISFALVLEFDVTRKGAGPAGCGRHVDEFMTGAVEALGDQAAVSADPKWDACGALAEALSDADPGTLIPAGAFVGGACERWEPSLAHLDFGYTDPIVGASRTATVGGVEVAVQEEDSTGKNLCWMSWRSGQWVGVAAPDCAQTKTLAESVLKVLATAPPSVLPQQPLLYGADEPDSPFHGACAHLEPNLTKHCAPFAEVAVPDGQDAVLRAAEADADVQCVVARDAIAEQFGPQLVPVTADDGSCYFVEPARQVQIRFRLGADSIAGVPDVFKVHEATVAGHPAYVADAQRAYEVWVAMSGDPDKNGSVELSVDGGPASRNAGPPADAKAKVDQAVADILRRCVS